MPGCRRLTHFLIVDRPVIAVLLQERDDRLEALARPSGLQAALEARQLEIPSSRWIDWSADLSRIQSQLRSGEDPHHA